MSRRPWFAGAPTRADFNQLADRLDWADEAETGVSSNVRKLYELDREQEREIARLRMVVEELTGLLVTAGVITEDALITRLEARRAAVSKSRAPSRPMVNCASCTTAVPQSDTYFSDLGEVCSLCFSG
ncbi:MAG: hypothetical protein P8R54_27325 [Myxococcota bacterium]|nr:hypothetical protein [Myxococcota bacterium]